MATLPNKENTRRPISDAEPSAKKARVDAAGPTLDVDPAAGKAEMGATAAVSSPSKKFTIRCTMGNPNRKLPSHIKTARKHVIQGLLKARGLDTNGTKSALLERLRTQLPSLVLEVDGRECLTGLLHSCLSHFGWDSTHLFVVKLPRRGDSKRGAVTLSEAMNLWEVGPAYRRMIGEYGLDLDDWPDRYAVKGVRRHIGSRYTMHDLCRAVCNPEALADFRRLSGSAFDPEATTYDYDMDKEVPAQGNLTLDELCLQKSDVCKFTYDIGNSTNFHVTITDVVDGEVAENAIGGLSVRAKLVKKGAVRVPSQYGH